MVEKTDFPQIIRKLQSTGLTTRMLAKKVGTSKSTIDRIKNTSLEPRFSTGQALLNLWIE